MAKYPKCYTLTRGDSKEFGDYDLVQLTLNHRVYPGSRKAHSYLPALCYKYPNTQFVCHYDFVYLASKYVVFNKSVKQAICDELSLLLSIDCPNFVGVVMHVDTAIKSKVRDSLFPEQTIDVEYNSKIFNLSKLKEYVGREWDLVLDSLVLLSEDLHKTGKLICNRIYLENTVKTPFPFKSSIAMESIAKICWENRLYGVCYDTEHLYAQLGSNIDSLKQFINAHGSSIPILVHLNCIPAKVRPMSNLDRHSETTIAECSLYSQKDYEDIVQFLVDRGILFVREVKEEARKRELDLWEKL